MPIGHSNFPRTNEEKRNGEQADLLLLDSVVEAGQPCERADRAAGEGRRPLPRAGTSEARAPVSDRGSAFRLTSGKCGLTRFVVVISMACLEWEICAREFFIRAAWGKGES